MILLLAFLIGFLAGLRSLTPLAAVAWAAHLGWLKLQGTLALMGSTYSVAAFTLLALGELAADKWAKIPSRTTVAPLIARILVGALTGACIAAAGGESGVLGAVVGAAGGVAGAFGGYHSRRWIVRSRKAPDLAVALTEDAIAIAGSLWIVARLG